MNPRELVIQILEQFERRPGPLDRLIEYGLRNQNTIDRRDRRFIFELTYGIIRRQLTIDYVLEQFLENKQSKSNSRLMRILRLGAYQIMYMDRVPPHAAVNESVQIAKSDKKTRFLSSTVNAVLRKLVQRKGRYPQPNEKTPLVQRLSIQYSHPEWLIQRWMKQFGLARTRKLLAFNNEKPAVFLRRKVKGLSRQQFDAEVRSIADGVGGYMNLFYRLTRSIPPEEIRLFEEGLCTVQSVSAGWVVGLMDVQKGDVICELCAAPGGKATLMAELTGERGVVIAADADYDRLQLIRQTQVRMQVMQIITLACDAQHPPFAAQFQRVLVDVPCSGTGVMHRHPDARWVRREEDIVSLSQKQQQILNKAAELVAPQGTLVYATCSLEREENQQQIERFLQKHPEFCSGPIPRAIPQTYIDNDGYLSITPYEHGLDGMFGAVLKRA
ncbi:MAG: 16S rRNA (cytosine(967)-C(5))-methyltransferase RsmB [Chitinispirillaceae bacterium]